MSTCRAIEEGAVLKFSTITVEFKKREANFEVTCSLVDLSMEMTTRYEGSSSGGERENGILLNEVTIPFLCSVESVYGEKRDSSKPLVFIHFDYQPIDK